MRVVVCCLLVVGLLWPTVVSSAVQKPVAVQAGDGYGVRSAQGEKEELHPIVLYAIWKFIEGVGWVIIGYCLVHIWQWVWDHDAPEPVDSSGDDPLWEPGTDTRRKGGDSW